MTKQARRQTFGEWLDALPKFIQYVTVFFLIVGGFGAFFGILMVATNYENRPEKMNHLIDEAMQQSGYQVAPTVDRIDLAKICTYGMQTNVDVIGLSPVYSAKQVTMQCVSSRTRTVVIVPLPNN